MTTYINFLIAKNSVATCYTIFYFIFLTFVLGKLLILVNFDHQIVRFLKIPLMYYGQI